MRRLFEPTLTCAAAYATGDGCKSAELGAGVVLKRIIDTRRFGSAAMALALSLLVSACASSNDAAKLLNPDPPDKMYAEADQLLSPANTKPRQRNSKISTGTISPRSAASHGHGRICLAARPRSDVARRYTTMHPGTKEAALAHHIIISYFYAKSDNRDQANARKALAELQTRGAI